MSGVALPRISPYRGGDMANTALPIPGKQEAQEDLVHLYRRIVEIHGDPSDGKGGRVASTKGIAMPGRGTLIDAQTFFAKEVLRVVFHPDDATDLVATMRAAFNGETDPPPPRVQAALDRVDRDDVREGLSVGVAAAAPLTEKVEGLGHGTDLMVNVFANTEAALQIFGIDTTPPAPVQPDAKDKESGVMDQGAIDALFD